MPTEYRLAREEFIVDKLTEVWRTDWVPQLVANSCVLASKVATEVLNYFGVPCEEVAVSAFAMNEKMHEHFKDGVAPENWDDDAWSVGVAPDERAGLHPTKGVDKRDPLGFAGHLIVSTKHHLLDLSALQFHRPERQIFVDGPLLALHDATTLVRAGGRSYLRLTLQEGFIFYEPFQTNIYKKSNDWRKNYTSIVGTVIRRLKPLVKHFEKTTETRVTQWQPTTL